MFLADAKVTIFRTVQTDSLSTLDVSGRYSEDPTFVYVQAGLPAARLLSPISGC
jgi:hypothetical protein